MLESFNIIYLLPPYSGNSIKRLTRSPKLYFYDSGLLCYLNGITNIEELLRAKNKGEIFASYVISEIMKGYNNTLESASFCFYHDDGGKEIDLIIQKGLENIPIEIKFNATPQKEMVSSFSSIDYKIGALITLGEKETLLKRKMS